jgi:hypothetical protein
MTMLAMLALLGGCGTCEKLTAAGQSARTCPRGDVKLVLSAGARDVQRGELGTFELVTEASWVEDQARSERVVTRPFTGDVKVQARLEGADVPVVLTALEPIEGRDGARVGRITLPQVPDGDHVLVVDVDAGFDQATVRVPLSFYSPALVHVLSDRPIYRPGEDVQLRSLVLARADQVPLGERPGRWRIVASDGVELLDEPAKAGPWGVAATSLPLDRDAPHGTYRATYESGADRDTITFEVRPFELPKITMDVSSQRRWSEAGDPVTIEGTARYRSGAPIADTEVELQLRRMEGAWPLPLDWTTKKTVRTDRFGRFTYTWGEVPNDIRDRVVIGAHAAVTEAGGESTTATTRLTLSQYPLHGAVLTELGEALAAGRNNRAYIRVMRPDGTPVPDADVEVANPWNPAAGPKTAKTDADGVLSVQIDPGDPVTLVIPPMPVRRRPPPPAPPPDRPEVTDARRAFGPLDLVEQRALPPLEDRMRRCQTAEVGAQNVDLTVRVVGGRVALVRSADPTETARCLERELVGLPWPTPGPETYEIDARLPRSLQPSFRLDTRTAVGDAKPVEKRLLQASGIARRCTTPGRGEDGADVLVVHWMVPEESTVVGVDVSRFDEHGLPASTLACVERAFAGLRLDEETEADLMGSTRLSLVVPALPGVPKPPPAPKATTKEGFELTLRATVDGRGLGSVPLQFATATMPAVRVRMTPPVVTAGQTVKAEILRSGDVQVELPEELVLKQDGKEVAREELDGNAAVFTVPADADGFMDVGFRGSTARVFVQRADRLALSLSTDRDTYRPGETASIEVRTEAGGKGRQAAVGLVGVDAALGQLMPLPGPDAYGRVTVRATSDQPAFGTFDAHALLLGRIRGENARQAAVLRISSLPTDRFERPTVNGGSSTRPDQATAQALAFERALLATAEAVRAWERKADPGETLDNAKMVGFWQQALADLRKSGRPATDAYGRELQLRRLPVAQLEQLDPQNVVGDGTRIPEDRTGWTHFVATEVTDG